MIKSLLVQTKLISFQQARARWQFSPNHKIMGALAQVGRLTTAGQIPVPIRRIIVRNAGPVARAQS